jgi:hypothetical protein
VLDGSRGEVNQNRASTTVAMTRLANGHYLLFVAGSDMAFGWFYLSDRPYIAEDTNWVFVDFFTRSKVDIGVGSYRQWCTEMRGTSDIRPGVIEPFRICPFLEGEEPISDPLDLSSPQNVGLVTECGTGDIYLFAMGNPEYRERGERFDPDSEWEQIDLFQLHPTPEEIRWEHVAKRRAFVVGEGSCTFRAGSGVHVTPSHQLIVYCSTHHPDDGDEELKFEEYILGNTDLR